MNGHRLHRKDAKTVPVVAHNEKFLSNIVTSFSPFVTGSLSGLKEERAGTPHFMAHADQ